VRATSYEVFVVTGSEQRASAVGQVPQDGSEITATRRIERGCRFIHQQDLRPHREGTGDRDALRFTT